MAEVSLVLQDVSKEFQIDGKPLEVLKNISLEVYRGEFVCIVGKSGCGKSTLLRLISGLDKTTSGTVLINGQKVTSPTEECGLIFQESRLFPWLKVKQNVEYGIPEKKKKQLSKKEREELVNQYIKLVNLEGFENATPRQLSGGMQQRVSIARSLIDNPQVLLLDEPFGALDALTRMNMQKEVLRIWEEHRTTMVLVTHDIDEAIYLADRIVVLSSNPGEISEIVDVKLSRPRKRSGVEFSEIRRKIYAHLFEDEEIFEDYVI